MNKTELIDAMASKTGMTKKNAEAALNAFVETVSEELVKGGKVALTEGRNPQTGETMKIAASKAPKFKAGKVLKDQVNA